MCVVVVVVVYIFLFFLPVVLCLLFFIFTGGENFKTRRGTIASSFYAFLFLFSFPLGENVKWVPLGKWNIAVGERIHISTFGGGKREFLKDPFKRAWRILWFLLAPFFGSWGFSLSPLFFCGVSGVVPSFLFVCTRRDFLRSNIVFLLGMREIVFFSFSSNFCGSFWTDSSKAAGKKGVLLRALLGDTGKKWESWESWERGEE